MSPRLDRLNHVAQADTYTLTVSNSGQGPALGTTSVTGNLPVSWPANVQKAQNGAAGTITLNSAQTVTASFNEIQTASRGSWLARPGRSTAFK